MNMSISHADDFTRSHPVLTGKRKGTTLRERLERIRDTTRKASVRKAAEQWLREMEAKASLWLSCSVSAFFHRSCTGWRPCDE